jgi:hypothetical protein
MVIDGFRGGAFFNISIRYIDFDQTIGIDRIFQSISNIPAMISIPQNEISRAIFDPAREFYYHVIGNFKQPIINYRACYFYLLMER